MKDRVPHIDSIALVELLSEVTGASYTTLERRLERAPFDKSLSLAVMEGLVFPVPLPGESKDSGGDIREAAEHATVHKLMHISLEAGGHH